MLKAINVLRETLVTDTTAHSKECDCFKCKIKTIQVSPSATPSRRKANQKPNLGNNSWEKGIVTDGRGMPHLSPGTIEPMPIKTYVENRRKIDEGKRRMKQADSQEE